MRQLQIMIKLVCWNIAAQRKEVWDELFSMDADVALLQEVKPVPSELPSNVELDPFNLCEPWDKKLFDRWPTVVRLSNRVKVEWFRRVLPTSYVECNEMAVSGIGTISAAKVITNGRECRKRLLLCLCTLVGFFRTS